MAKRQGPRACLQTTDNRQTRPIELAGVHVNINEIARVSGLDVGGISRVLAGKANPTQKYLQKIADALDMPIGDLIAAIADRAA